MHFATPLRRRSVPFIVAIAALGCAERVTAGARPIAGCYHLESFPVAGASVPVAPLPDTVRLFDARGDEAHEEGRALLRAWPDSLRTDYRWSWWEIAMPDTLTLVFTTGHAGARIALRPTTDGFSGAMSTFSDVEPVPSRGGLARLRSIVCGAAG